MKKMLLFLGLFILVFAFAVNADVYSDYPDACGSEVVRYLGSDRTTFGTWEEYYGSYAYILSGMDVSTATHEWPISGGDSSQYDITGGPGMPNIQYSVYTERCVDPDHRALETPDETQRRAACYWGDSTITLNIPAGTYQLAVYLIDWDSYNRIVKLDVTDSSGMQTRTVSSFHDGVYEIFNVNGGTVTIKLTKTGGSNSVISGIFLDSAGATTSTRDTTTQGDWVGNYGSQWYLLSAMDSIYTWSNNQPEDQAYDVKGGSLPVTYTVSNGNYWAWTDYYSAGGCTMGNAYAWAWPTADYRALTGGSSSWTSRASCWDDGGEQQSSGPHLYVDLTIPDGYYLLSFYTMDYDSTCRKQIIHVLDKATGIELTASPDELISNGVYYTFFVIGGEYKVIAEYTGCTNAVISGIFIDQLICEEPTLDFRTIGFWKHQFAVATGNNKGSAQIDTATLQSYLPLYGVETLQQGYSTLWLGKKATKQQKAVQQCFASWLNYANNGVGYYTWVDTDYDKLIDTQFIDAMNQAQAFMDLGDYNAAKDICDSINNMAEAADDEGDMITGYAVSENAQASLLAFVSVTSIIALVVVSIFSITRKK